jgi:hypothetical protein
MGRVQPLGAAAPAKHAPACARPAASGRSAGGGRRGGGRPGRRARAGARLVEHERERPGERQQRDHEELDEPGRVRAQAQAVARADGLRDDLREHDQQRGGDEQAGDAGGHVGQQDGQERCARGGGVAHRVSGARGAGAAGRGAWGTRAAGRGARGAGPAGRGARSSGRGQGSSGPACACVAPDRAACMSRRQDDGCCTCPAPFGIRCDDGTRASGGTGQVRMRSASVAARRAQRASGRGWARVGRQPAGLVSRG